MSNRYEYAKMEGCCEITTGMEPHRARGEHENNRNKQKDHREITAGIVDS